MSTHIEGRTSNGRPIYEPPIFNYSMMIGEEYDKQRETVLEFYAGDVVQTTAYLRAFIELILLEKHEAWAEEEIADSHETDDRTNGFMKGLLLELDRDGGVVHDENWNLGVQLRRNADGTYYVWDHGDGAASRAAIQSREPVKNAPETPSEDTIPPISPQKPSQTAETTANPAPSTTPRMSAQPHTEVTESTALLSRTSYVHDDDIDEPFSTAICGCLWS